MSNFQNLYLRLLDLFRLLGYDWFLNGVFSDAMGCSCVLYNQDSGHVLWVFWMGKNGLLIKPFKAQVGCVRINSGWFNGYRHCMHQTTMS
ncbi:hypothetical protein HanRHA438_Chr07g0305961 [Helianthus annuus]|uniref:Uncharacterized protein n=1 Tax=Helianthus annuus TaxID=4232 RepID=A0A9K3IKH7_HELAN|nr:hypothetical protein HanXRQr2_Chr07g0295621 [Helianthus annuus]KAJ0908040.1 hypothetical protein HanRHA438_Chr07g0305961 [Helianthus annuus]